MLDELIEKKKSKFLSYRSKVWQSTSRGGLPKIFFKDLNFSVALLTRNRQELKEKGKHEKFKCFLKGEWNKKGDYVGKAALEKMGKELKEGKKPYKLQLVGLELGGKPIEEYAPDFWLISPESGGDPVGFITSPWYHPEKKQNIAMGYVPFDGTLNANGFPKGKVGTKYKVHLPDIYSETPGTPVDAVVVDIPFKESFNANTREVVKG